MAIPHSRAHPLLDEAPRATPPRSTARPNPGLHLTRNHPGGTRPRQFPRGEAQLRKKDVRVEATNGPPRGRLRDGPAPVHRGSRAIHRAPTRPRLRRGHRADWKGAFHPATSTHRAPRPASSSEPIHEVKPCPLSIFSQTFADARHVRHVPFRDRRSDSMRSPPSTTRRVRPTSSVQSA